MFVVLVLSKVHSVAKNGLVAAYVEGSETLIAANAQLGRVAAVSVVLVAGPGVLALKLGSAELVLWLSALVYLGSTLLNLRLPKPRSDHVPQIVPTEDAALRAAACRRSPRRRRGRRASVRRRDSCCS